jgi:hypothetical protein
MGTVYGTTDSQIYTSLYNINRYKARLLHSTLYKIEYGLNESGNENVVVDTSMVTSTIS